MSSDLNFLFKVISFILISGFSAGVVFLLTLSLVVNNWDEGGIFVIAIVIGTVPGFIARSKGRNFFLWWLYGFAILIVAMPHSILIGNVKRKKCLFCETELDVDAVACNVCGRDLPVEAS